MTQSQRAQAITCELVRSDVTGKHRQRKSGVIKVSQNAPERPSGVRKFKSGTFRLQNYWISQPELTFTRAKQVSNLLCSNPIRHSNFKFLLSQIHNIQCIYKILQN